MKNKKSGAQSSPAPQSYHHGALREALIDAAQAQIRAAGVESLSIAGLCKTLGVSSAAPYKHFKDRDALIGEVTARGFRALEAATREARDQQPKGSVESMVAIGRAYVTFVASDPEMFHVMWGMTREVKYSEVGFNAGRQCFQVLIDCVGELQRARGLTHIDPMTMAVNCWSGVHGVSALIVGERLKVAEGLDILKTVEFSTRAYIAGVEAMARSERPDDA